jgi:Protein of unknown function (DUF4240)
MTSIRLVPAVVAAMLAASPAGVGLSWPPAASAQSKAGKTSIEPMAEQRFWDLIGRTTPFESDPERQVAALHAALEPLPLGEIEAFTAAFNRAMARSYSWDLWGAAYVANGGVSDDGFEYFRQWLISKGRKTFEQVLANPDSLAEIVAPRTKGALELEWLRSVAFKVWSAKSGRPAAELATAAAVAYPREPTGTPFTEDEAHLRGRYPKLWRRFGANPLQ